jgi:hypothetical protein
MVLFIFEIIDIINKLSPTVVPNKTIKSPGRSGSGQSKRSTISKAKNEEIQKSNGKKNMFFFENESINKIIHVDLDLKRPALQINHTRKFFI